MQYKDFKVEYKEAEDNGMICGYASTFNDETPDVYGDVVRKGAFKNSLAKIEKEGKTIPFVWAHRMDDLSSYLGSCKAHEDDHGLYFEATLDATPEAQRVRQLFKDGRLNKFSFAYSVLDEGPVTLANGMKANELREVDIYEITACLVPANQNATVVDVKSGANDENEHVEEKAKEEADGDNVVLTEDQKLLNLEKFDLLQLIKKLEKNTKN